MVKKLGLDAVPGEDDQVSRLRAVILNLAESVGNKEVSDDALKRFENPEKIHPSLKSLVYTVVAKSGEENWNKLLEMFKAAELQETRLLLMRAMGAVAWCDDESLLKRYYDWVTYSGDVPAQDIYVSFSSAGSGNPGFAINYIIENWKKIDEVCSSTFTYLISNIFSTSATWAHSQEQLDALHKFFDGKENIEYAQFDLNKTYETISKQYISFNNVIVNKMFVIFIGNRLAWRERINKELEEGLI